MKNILVQTERGMVQTSATMVVVVWRARIIVWVVMFRRAMLMAGALMVPRRLDGVGCEHTGSQTGNEADDEEPC